MKFVRKKFREINTPDSKTKILVIPTNEEIEIANQVFELLMNKKIHSKKLL